MKTLSKLRSSQIVPIIFLKFLTIQPSWAIQAFSEEQYFEEYGRSVLPAYEQGESGTFLGKGSISIAYLKFERDPDEEHGALIILPGLGEPMLKYAEVIHDLADLKLSIYIMAPRGQGESDLVEGVTNRFVQSYRDYVEDLVTFMTIVNQRPHSKRFLLAHSMGAAIGSLYSLHQKREFDAAVFSAPMFDMATPGYPRSMVYPLAWTVCNIFRLGKYGAGTDNAPRTSSKIRQQMADQADLQFLEKKANKVSFRWGLASLRAIKHLHKNREVFDVPYLILQAGKDLHVPSGGQDFFFEGSSQPEMVIFKDSLHEVLMEQDSIREEALNKIRSFFMPYL